MARSKPVPALSLLLLLACGGIGVRTAAAADLFYTRLLERGTRELELALPHEALETLRIASFGLLDEPLLLTEALMQLGRAQALTGETAGLAKTAERLTEIEDRFGAYSQFNGALKSAFENALLRSLPEASLARMPLFSHLPTMARARAAAPASLNPKDRRKALEETLESDPADTRSLMALAQLLLDTGKPKLASTYLDRLLAIEPEDQGALCLRSRIAIDKKECAPALAGLDSCADSLPGDKGLAFLIACLASAGRNSEAADFVASLPVDRKNNPVIARAVRKNVPSAEAVESPPVDAFKGAIESTNSAVLTEETVAVPEPPPTGSQETLGNASALEERIQSLRAEIAASQFREQLQTALGRAMTLADDYPDSAEAQYMAAEIAYLTARWQLVLDYFERGGDAPADRPDLSFYLAVAHYELGNALEAAAILEPALPALPRNSFVETYIDKIFAAPPS